MSEEKILETLVEEKLVEEGEAEEEFIEVEFTTRTEAIQSAYASISACEEFDLGMLPISQQKIIKRIRRKSIRIIDECIGEIYDEIFDDGNNNEDE
jgi:hypothetical protein